MHEDRADDAERRRLERDVVRDLVDPVGGPLVLGQLRQRALAGEDEDQVVGIDAPEARRLRQRRRAVDRRPLDVGDLDRLALVERVRQAALDLHPARRAATPR